jgi:hypothetical protein
VQSAPSSESTGASPPNRSVAGRMSKIARGRTSPPHRRRVAPTRLTSWWRRGPTIGAVLLSGGVRLCPGTKRRRRRGDFTVLVLRGTQDRGDRRRCSRDEARSADLGGPVRAKPLPRYEETSAVWDAAPGTLIASDCSKLASSSSSSSSAQTMVDALTRTSVVAKFRLTASEIFLQNPAAPNCRSARRLAGCSVSHAIATVKARAGHRWQAVVAPLDVIDIIRPSRPSEDGANRAARDERRATSRTKEDKKECGNYPMPDKVHARNAKAAPPAAEGREPDQEGARADRPQGGQGPRRLTHRPSPANRGSTVALRVGTASMTG